MKFTNTLAVVSILSAVFVAAVPVPAELDVAYEPVTAREITDMVLDEIFERQNPNAFRHAFKKAFKDTADMFPKKIIQSVANAPGAYRPGTVLRPSPKLPAAKPPRPISIKPEPITFHKAATGLKGANKWKNAWEAGQKKAAPKPTRRQTSPLPAAKKSKPVPKRSKTM